MSSQYCGNGHDWNSRLTLSADWSIWVDVPCVDAALDGVAAPSDSLLLALSIPAAF
jgi:hypothetical protein